MDQVFSDQNAILKPALTDYNKAYINYLECNTINASGKINIGCDNTTNAIQRLTDASNALMAAIQTVQSDLDNIDPSNDNGTQIKTNYQKMANYRSQLDLKLQELYNDQHSLPNLQQAQVDSTVYAGILWTVLATSLLYYVFIKM